MALYGTVLPDTFEHDIEVHRRTGFVLDTPDFFFVWRMVGLSWPLERMRDPAFSVRDSKCAWLWVLAGDIQKAATAALALCPQTRYIGYERRGRPKLVPLERFLRS